MQQLLLASIRLDSSGKVLVDFVERQRHTDEDIMYGASLDGPKTLQHNILRVFKMSDYKYLRKLLVKTRNRKRLILQ